MSGGDRRDHGNHAPDLFDDHILQVSVLWSPIDQAASGRPLSAFFHSPQPFQIVRSFVHAWYSSIQDLEAAFAANMLLNLSGQRVFKLDHPSTA